MDLQLGCAEAVADAYQRSRHLVAEVVDHMENIAAVVEG